VLQRGLEVVGLIIIIIIWCASQHWHFMGLPKLKIEVASL